MPSSEVGSTPRRAARALHLRNGGTSVVVDLEAAGFPTVVYWGAELADHGDADALALAVVPQRVSGGLDVPARQTLLPQEANGWFGTPGLSGHRNGRDFTTKLTDESVDATESSCRNRARDEGAALEAELELEVTGAGLFRQRITITNQSEAGYTVDHILAGFPTPADATELLDTTGRHLRERSPQRHPFTFGSYLRESRRGRPGADASLLLAAGTPGFGFERGIVHAIHVAWSGNHRMLAERTPAGDAYLAGGELLAPGEIILAQGESYGTPWVVGSWGDGLSALASRFHDELRARDGYPRRARPVTLNTWEAVYFDHDLARLTALADAAAGVGVERYVLDDGWFTGRRDDTAGLGDWFVDPDVWPEGLHPLIDHVTSLGMEFGLWVEPEMVNPRSRLAAEHPDWLLRGRDALPPAGRQQQVLDLSNPDAFAYLEERLDALLSEYRISYLKWDHNRDLAEAGSGPHGSARVHANVLALYRLLENLKRRHPGVEIESCASGGARVDLGILEHTDRIWTSDCLDPLERLQIQKYTGLLVPPELMGAHLTSPTVHSTGRTVSLALSAGVALFGHFGIEWDLTAVDAAAPAEVTDWVAFAKSIRDLVATGRVIHADLSDPALDVRGVVAADGSRAVVTVTQVTTSVTLPTAPVRIPGLNDATRYAVAIRSVGSAQREPGQSPLAWAQGDLILTGRSLATTGIRPPVQHPQRQTILTFTAVD